MGDTPGPVWQFSTLGGRKGDLNYDDDIDLSDVVLGSQVLAGIDVAPDFRIQADVDGDLKIGMAEIAYDF